MDRILGDISNWTYYVITGLVTSVIWLIRKVLTNERQVELLKKEIEIRNDHHKEIMAEIRSQLTELRADVKSAIGR